MDIRTKRIKMILPVPLPQRAIDHFAERIPSGRSEVVCEGLFEQITPILRNC
jgi:hypothetical protein